MKKIYFSELAQLKTQDPILIGGNELFKIISKPKKRLHILAMGDVGGTLLLALRMLGGDVIGRIGIFDLSEQVCIRYEAEINQISYPFEFYALPEVETISEDQLFSCDIFVFCAAKGVPELDSKTRDVRMAQYKANASLISGFAIRAAKEGFQGLFAVVSDPVDPLCAAANRAAFGVGNGLPAQRIKGFGLGVMNARAAYYAKRDPKFSAFLKDGRAFGPHGTDLVIADSIVNYNDEISKELTILSAKANLEIRKTGFKPYIAPALSSAAISILLLLRGAFHYSSTYLNGVYFGAKNRITPDGNELENLCLPKVLFDRLEHSYRKLADL